MAKVNRIHWLSMAKISSFIYMIIGSVLGLNVTVASLLGADLSQGQSGYAWVNKIAVIVFPFIYGIVGFIAGSLMALLFNAATKFLGGLQVDVES